jgi:uncharacterized protein (TIGR02453 family)
LTLALSNIGPLERFDGFSADALVFFRELSANMNKDWFTANRTRYEHNIHVPLTALVGALSADLQAAGLPLCGDPKRSVFRIYRDLRFSHDKSPYKTNASCALTRDGEKLSPGVLYFQLDPEGSFAAVGFYAPEPATLHRMREDIARDPKGWIAMASALGHAGLELSLEDTLVRPPKGFEGTPPEISDALKLKSWVVRKTIADQEIASAGLVDVLARLAQDAEPLLMFGWKALDRRR